MIELDLSHSRLLTFDLSLADCSPVQIIKPLKQYKSSCETSVTLVCELSNHTARVMWLKDGEPIRACDKYKMTIEGHLHKLIIRNVCNEDEAVYSMVVDGESTSYYLVPEIS